MKRLDHLITVLIILYFQLSFLVQTTTTEVRNISYINKSLLWRLRPPTLATITCTLRALFVLKGLCLAAVAEGRDEEAWPISWLTQHLIVVAMLVKLLLFLIAASSLRVSFSISQHALCCKLYSFNFSLFFFSFLLHDCRSLQMRDGDFLFSCQLIWGFLKLFVEHLFSIVLELPENISPRHFQRVLNYGLFYKGLFTCCWWMITNLE